MPISVALAWSYVDITLPKLIKGYRPTATPDAVRIGRLHSYYDSGKAKRELGYVPGPVKAAVKKAVDWYRLNGYAP
jgi:dihydroflavonol-4-reductase